jgi:hypothetical protein
MIEYFYGAALSASTTTSGFSKAPGFLLFKYTATLLFGQPALHSHSIPRALLRRQQGIFDDQLPS